MSTQPAITALAILDLLQRHLAEPWRPAERTGELRALLADDVDVVQVILEIASVTLGIAAETSYPLPRLIDDYRNRLHADAV